MRDLRNKYLIKHQVEYLEFKCFPSQCFMHLLLNQRELAFSL